MLAADTGSPNSIVKTAWPTVILAITAGVLAAFQAGKVHIALPSVRASFSLTLVASSFILSALNVVGLFTATPFGTICARIGNKTSVVTGLVLIAIASGLGAMSTTVNWLLVTRLLEGIGYVIVVVAAPSLIVQVTRSSNLRIVLAVWSAYVPGGIALMSFLGPYFLAHGTWRTIWWFNAVLVAAVALIMAIVPAPVMMPRPVAPAGMWLEFRTVLTSRGPLLLALIFGTYTTQHLGIMGFLPTLLHERFHLPEARIGALTAAAMASNVLGNLAAGVLLQRGVSRSLIITATSVFMICMSIGMFVLPLPLAGFYACAFGFSCIGGLIPSSVMGAAPFHAPSPSLIGATNGLLVQGSNLGFVFGPPIMGAIATHYGWNWVPAASICAAVAAIVLANNLRTTTHSRPDFNPAAAGD